MVSFPPYFFKYFFISYPESDVIETIPYFKQSCLSQTLAKAVKTKILLLKLSTFMISFIVMYFRVEAM